MSELGSTLAAVIEISAMGRSPLGAAAPGVPGKGLDAGQAELADQGGERVSLGEAFDPSPQNIESRLVRRTAQSRAVARRTGRLHS